MNNLNVLLLGSGGREHAIAWKLSQSPRLNHLFVAPGNPGTAKVADNIALNPLDFEAVANFVSQQSIDMVVVGPEEPLVRGISDFLRNTPSTKHVMVIGPQQQAATLEGSKNFAKEFMQRHNIPTAKYRTFDASEVAQAKEFMLELKPPFVLKADGLAAGKGVIIEPDYHKACQALNTLFAGQFGDASQKVVIEEFMTGIELSVFVLTDGESYLILPEAKDYKRIGDGDTGANTGGMGAVSPVPFANQQFMQRVEERIVRPTIDGLRADGIPYNGFIFIGLMNVDGNPFVVEYNVRMGDPETEVVMPRIKSDLLPLLERCAQGQLKGSTLETHKEIATTVIVVSDGYPGSYPKGIPITHCPNNTAQTIAFHAGTSVSNDQLVTAGGRVMACTALAPTLDKALAMSYDIAQSIQYQGKFYRRDIGLDLK